MSYECEEIPLWAYEYVRQKTTLQSIEKLCTESAANVTVLNKTMTA